MTKPKLSMTTGSNLRCSIRSQRRGKADCASFFGDLAPTITMAGRDFELFAKSILRSPAGMRLATSIKCCQLSVTFFLKLMRVSDLSENSLEPAAGIVKWQMEKTQYFGRPSLIQRPEPP